MDPILSFMLNIIFVSPLLVGTSIGYEIPMNMTMEGYADSRYSGRHYFLTENARRIETTTMIYGPFMATII